MGINADAVTPEQMEQYECYQNELNRAASEWRAGTGARWADRNPTDVEGTNASWMTRYGKPKTWVVHDALRTVPRDVKWLEIGCSSGAHSRVLEAVGFRGLVGTDVNRDSLLAGSIGRVCQADAAALPYPTDGVDGITTGGTLMHLGPADRLTESVREIFRVARSYVFLVELWSAEPMMVLFGDLLPPAWLYPWEQVLLPFMDDGWEVVYHEVHHLIKIKGQSKLTAPMGVTLIARKGL